MKVASAPSSDLYDRDVSATCISSSSSRSTGSSIPVTARSRSWNRDGPEGVRVTDELVWRPAALDRETLMDLR